MHTHCRHSCLFDTACRSAGPKGACEARLNSLVKANVTRTKRNNEVRLQMFFDDVRRGFYDELIGKSQKAPLPEGYQPKQRTLNATQRGVLEFLESQGGKAYVIDLPGMITRIRTSNGGVSTTIRPGQARDLTNMIQLGLVYVDTGFVGPKGTRVSLTGNGKQYVQKYLTKSAKTAEPGTVADAMQKIDRGQVVKVKTPAGYVTARRGDSPHLNMPGQQSKYYVWRGQSATGRAMFTFTSRGELESWLNSVIGNQKAAKATDIKVGDAVVVPNGAAAPYGEMGYAGFVGMVMAIQGNRAKVKPVRAPMVGKWRVYTVPLNVLRIAPGWVGHG